MDDHASRTEPPTTLAARAPPPRRTTATSPPVERNRRDLYNTVGILPDRQRRFCGVQTHDSAAAAPGLLLAPGFVSASFVREKLERHAVQPRFVRAASRLSRAAPGSRAARRPACYDVMISYRVPETGGRGDGETQALKAELEKYGYLVFVGEEIPAGAPRGPHPRAVAALRRRWTPPHACAPAQWRPSASCQACGPPWGPPQLRAPPCPRST